MSSDWEAGVWCALYTEGFGSRWTMSVSFKEGLGRGAGWSKGAVERERGAQRRALLSQEQRGEG
jgi:hypothetical protein